MTACAFAYVKRSRAPRHAHRRRAARAGARQVRVRRRERCAPPRAGDPAARPRRVCNSSRACASNSSTLYEYIRVL